MTPLQDTIVQEEMNRIRPAETVSVSALTRQNGPVKGQSAGFSSQMRFLLSKQLKLKLRYVMRTCSSYSYCILTEMYLIPTVFERHLTSMICFCFLRNKKLGSAELFLPVYIILFLLLIRHLLVIPYRLDYTPAAAVSPKYSISSPTPPPL